MRAMLAEKTWKSDFIQKYYGTTKRELKSGTKKTYMNQYAAFLVAGQNGGCYYF
jgi:hypothetical protein